MKRSKISEKWRGNNIYPNRYAVLYILPAVLFMICLCLFPVLVLIANSFTDLTMVGKEVHFVGLKNFKEILSSQDFYRQFGLTLIYVAASVLTEMVLGFFLALMFQVSVPLKRLARTLMILPMVATPVAMCFLWSIMYNPKMGILNYLLSLFGIGPQLWVSSPGTAIWSIILVDIWMNTPFVFLIFSSGMTALPQDPFEAAIVDGAGSWTLIRSILLPTIKPIFTVVLMFRVIDAFKVFDLIYVLTGGGPGNATETVNIAVYFSAFRYYKMGHASAMALIMYIFVFLLSVVVVKKGKLSLA